MTSALDLLYRVLREDPGVAGVVGNRIHAIVAPQTKPMPYIVTSLAHEDQDIVLNGHLDGWQSRVGIECVAETATGAVDLGEAVKSALSIVCRRIMSDDSPAEELGIVTFWKEGTDVVDYTEDRTVFRRIIDFRMRWTR